MGGSGVALQGDRGPFAARGLKGDSDDKGPVGSRGPAGKRGVEGPEGPPGKIGKMGPVGSKGEIGARGEEGDKGDTGGVGQQGPIGPRDIIGPRVVQGSEGLRGIVDIQGPLGVEGTVDTTGDRGPKGDKGDRGAPAVEIDIVSELCKHLHNDSRSVRPRCLCSLCYKFDERYIELNGAARVKTIIDKGGRCNASQTDVRRMATQVNSNYVLDFHNDAFNMEADIYDFHYLCVFLVY